MLKPRHEWSDLQSHLTKIKIAVMTWASFYLVEKSLFGNICQSLTNCPATAAKGCIKNALFFFFPLNFSGK